MFSSYVRTFGTIWCNICAFWYHTYDTYLHICRCPESNNLKNHKVPQFRVLGETRISRHFHIGMYTHSSNVISVMGMVTCWHFTYWEWPFGAMQLRSQLGRSQRRGQNHVDEGNRRPPHRRHATGPRVVGRWVSWLTDWLVDKTPLSNVDTIAAMVIKVTKASGC